LKTVNLTVYTWRSVCKPVWTVDTVFAYRFANRSSCVNALLFVRIRIRHHTSYQ